MEQEFLKTRFIEDQRFGPFGSIANRAHFIATRVQMAFKDHHNEDLLGGRMGGYLCVAEGETGNPHFTVLVGGHVNQEKLPKYYHLSHEKAVRLSQNPTHVSSFQSRDGKNQFGGAVRTLDGLIYSFSGFPELIDEALVLVLMQLGAKYRIREKTKTIEHHCNVIAELSNNKFYTGLENWCDV